MLGGSPSSTARGTRRVSVDTSASPHARLRPLAHDDAQLDGGFWAARQRVVRDTGLAHGYRMLEEWGNLDNLRLAAGSITGTYKGPVFMDSDVYKWLEAAAYHAPDGLPDDVQRMADDVIGLVQQAQAPDGYLDSYYQVVEPNRRWVDIPMGHELYCAGHLIQAAVAWQRFADDARLLDVARRAVEHILTVFGPGIRPGTPGHPEIEMALVELYRETADRRHLDLAQFFVDHRGHALLGPNPRFGGSAYYQDRVPVRDATEIEGHAVRALYLTSGLADLYLETGEPALLEALVRQWRDMVERRLYLTGGAGARHQGEAFGQPYELPNDRAYAETCAAIASVMWSWRMLLITGEAHYADLIERTLFNGFLSGMSLDGGRYFYVNPLLSPGQPEVLGRGGHERREWYFVACCPPNVMRLIATVGQYLASTDALGIQIHQYASAVLAANGVQLRLQTDYPWQGRVALHIEQTPDEPWQLRLRKPAWCTAPTLDGAAVDACDGYIVVDRTWRAADRLELDLPMPPRLTRAHPRIEACTGAVAIERGPLVYCLEQRDHPDANILDVSIDPRTPLDTTWQADLLGGVTTVTAHGAVHPSPVALYEPLGAPVRASRPVTLTAVPYFAWANREPGAMRVWIPHEDQ
jgi:uncharacterized protein